MKFGIFYELQLQRPWEPDGELRLYQNTLDQVELADRLGYDFAWEVEHHFLEEYSHSPAPVVFLGVASQRTRQIRLAHGMAQLTTSHPARVTERIAVLDLLSRSRRRASAVVQLARSLWLRRKLPLQSSVRFMETPSVSEGGSRHCRWEGLSSRLRRVAANRRRTARFWAPLSGARRASRRGRGRAS